MVMVEKTDMTAEMDQADKTVQAGSWYDGLQECINRS